MPNDKPVTTLKPKYSGKTSVLFWKQVAAIKNQRRKNQAYNIGCAIQQLESVLETLISEKKI